MELGFIRLLLRNPLNNLLQVSSLSLSLSLTHTRARIRMYYNSCLGWYLIQNYSITKALRRTFIKIYPYQQHSPLYFSYSIQIILLMKGSTLYTGLCLQHYQCLQQSIHPDSLCVQIDPEVLIISVLQKWANTWLMKQNKCFMTELYALRCIVNVYWPLDV